MRTAAEKLEAIEPIEADGKTWWPRDDVLMALKLRPERARRYIAAHPAAAQTLVRRGCGRKYDPGLKYAAINLEAVLALCVLSGIDEPLHRIRERLERRQGKAGQRNAMQRTTERRHDKTTLRDAAHD